MSNFYRITITTVGHGKNLPLDKYINNLAAKYHFAVQNQILLSANATATIMRRILMQSGYKLDKLASAISADIIREISGEAKDRNGVEIGIGEIANFPKDEKGNQYWNAFNDGWLPPENWGYFTGGSGLSGDKSAPAANSSGQKWVHTGKSDTRGNFYMIPRKPIRGLNFLGIGQETLYKHLQKEIAKIIKSL